MRRNLTKSGKFAVVRLFFRTRIDLLRQGSARADVPIWRMCLHVWIGPKSDQFLHMVGHFAILPFCHLPSLNIVFLYDFYIYFYEYSDHQ